MTTRDELLHTLAPILDAVRGLDLEKPDEAARMLAEKFPLEGELLRAVRAQFRNGVVEGWLCDRSAPPADDGSVVKYSRIAKDSGGWSIDAVHMSGPGGAHTHPNGEVDLCFAVSAGARFDGRAPGWTIYPPGSWHVPTVDGGEMDILYFLPKGAIVFGPKP